MVEEIKKILEDYKDETKRYFDVMAEDIKDKITTVSEQVGINTEKIISIQEKLEQHDQRFENMEGRLTAIEDRFENMEGRLTAIEDSINIIKLDIEFIKNELKQKVSRDEFAALERRVSILEAKLNK